MALTPERINELKEQAVSAWRVAGFEPILQVFVAQAIEAEVRKSDEALIRQMLESMCWAARVMTISEDEAPGYFAAITAARARLEGKP